MREIIKVSTPSRICLLGEHQDYLGLEVIATAINLRFSAQISKRCDRQIEIDIRDESIDFLKAENPEDKYNHCSIDLSAPITYKNNRDYLKSSVNVLLKNGYELCGADIKMDSRIPIGKGMCSSSTMIVVLIKALLEVINHPHKDDAAKIAYLAFAAEVTEFNEPGGMMDHFTSAIGQTVNLDFTEGCSVNKLDFNPEGVFILFDSLQRKDTTRVLAESKIPTLEAISQLSAYGITSVKDFLREENLQYLDKLDSILKRKLSANIENYKLVMDAKSDMSNLGELLNKHHKNLRDGLGISTPIIETILETALKNGAYGGKINGSGGGGCCFAYASLQNAMQVAEAVEALGYPAMILEQDTGVRRDF